MSKLNRAIIFLCLIVFFVGNIWSMERDDSSDDEHWFAAHYVELVAQAQEKMRTAVISINAFSVVEPTEAASDDLLSHNVFERDLASNLDELEVFFKGPLLHAWAGLRLSDKYQKTVYEAADSLSQSWLDFLWELPSGDMQRRFECIGMPFVLPAVVKVLTDYAGLCKRHKYGVYIKKLKALKDELEERCLTAADRVIAVNVVNDYIRLAQTKQIERQQAKGVRRVRSK